jgi:hypothetical protein
MRLPDFFVIGAAKAGTTSLYALLDRHPGIFMPEIKEPEFFARDDLYGQGIEGYAEKFAAARADQIVGEASTIYSLAPFFPKTAERIHRHVPDAKLIYVMRQPVERAYSFYVQILKNYQNVTRDYAVHRSFEDFILPERHARAAPRDKAFSRVNDHLPDMPDLCLAGSDYVAQIESYLAYFPRRNMLFLTFEDFVRDRRAALRQITDFLGAEPLADQVFDEKGVTTNISRAHFAALQEAASLQGFRRKAGPLWGLRQMLPRGLRRNLRRNLAGMGRPEHEPPKMQPETRSLLSQRFLPQIARLSELTGLEFEGWRQG